MLPSVVSHSMPLPLVVTLRLCILFAATARIGSGICFKGRVLRLAVSLAQKEIPYIASPFRKGGVIHQDLKCRRPLPLPNHVLQGQTSRLRKFTRRPQFGQPTQPPVGLRTGLLGLAKAADERPVRLDTEAPTF